MDIRIEDDKPEPARNVLGEPMLHNINGFVIKVWVILLGGSLTVKN